MRTAQLSRSGAKLYLSGLREGDRLFINFHIVICGKRA